MKKTLPIIDTHCSVGKGTDSELSADDLVAAMDANGVAKAIIAPVDRYLAVYNREGNDAMIEAGRRFPGRLYAMATANPWYGERALEEVKRTFGEGAVGLKLHPQFQGFNMTDPVVIPLLELAAELNKPVYFHTGVPICCMPFQLTELAMRFPEITFIMGHMGFSDFWYDVVAAVKAVENIYLESSPYWPDYVTDVVKKVGADRIMFGSDMPNNQQRLAIESIRLSSMSEKVKEQFFSRIAQRVFFEIK